MEEKVEVQEPTEQKQQKKQGAAQQQQQGGNKKKKKKNQFQLKTPKVGGVRDVERECVYVRVCVCGPLHWCARAPVYLRV